MNNPLFAFLLILIIQGYSLGFQSNLKSESEKARRDLAAAALDYKASLEKLLTLQEEDVKRAAEVVEERKAPLARRIIEQYDVDEAIRALTTAKEKVAHTKREIAKAEALAGTQLQRIKQGPPIRNPSSTNAAVIPLDTSDAKYIKDALSEMMSNSLAAVLAQERAEEIRQKSDAIFKPYCKCRKSEYRDWQNGQGLPSVIHRMDEANLSKRDSLLKLITYSK